MVIKQNYKGVKPNGAALGGGFPLIPEGEYLVVVKKTEETRSQNGNPMAKTRYMILDEGEFLGKLIFDNVVFCEKLAGRNKHLLKVLEQPYDGEIEIDPDAWVGQKLRVVVYHEEYEGKKRAKISQYLYKDEESEKAAHAEKPENGKKKNAKSEDKEVKKETKTNDDDSAVADDDEEIPF